MTLSGKKILVAITGSIAAYKCATLVRLLIKQGASVKVVMTESATAFISPLTLSTLSKHPVYTNVVDEDEWSNHVELGLWADMMVVAPATANTIAKMANGLCDSMVLAAYLSARCPVMVCPAMDLDMWTHPATQRNITMLSNDGNIMIDVAEGELASGLVGKGRMAEPEDVVSYIGSYFQKKKTLLGKRFLVTAGPTYEAIDPVRFIGNHSSGKMGYAIATELAERGAEVDLVSGPTHLSINHVNIKLHKVISASEMANRSIDLYSTMDGAVLAAAVADYTPKNKSDKKIKKKEGDMSIALDRTVDIAKTLGVSKKSEQLLVGFALETNDAVKNAKGKLERKNFDFIVLNTTQDKGAGFKHDTNKITILDKHTAEEFDLKSKKMVAVDIINRIETLFK